MFFSLLLPGKTSTVLAVRELKEYCILGLDPGERALFMAAVYEDRSRFADLSSGDVGRKKIPTLRLSKKHWRYLIRLPKHRRRRSRRKSMTALGI